MLGFSESDLYSVQHRFRTDVFETVLVFLSPLKKCWNLSTRTTCRFSDKYNFTNSSTFYTKFTGDFAVYLRILLRVTKYRSVVPSLETTGKHFSLSHGRPMFIQLVYEAII